MRALYLDGLSQPLTVELDGPALRVVRPALADARIPLGAISRIVARGPVDWSGGALAACLAQGLPVTFVDGHGRPLGYGIAARPRSSDLHQLLVDATERADWPARQADWVRAMERRVMLDVLRRLRLKLRDLRPLAVHGRLAELVAAAGGPIGPHALMAELQGLLDAWLIGSLGSHGIGRRFLGQMPAGVDLRADFHRAMVWLLWPVALRLAGYLARHGGKHRTEAALRRRIVRQFEAETPRLEAWFRRLLRACEEHLWRLQP